MGTKRDAKLVQKGIVSAGGIAAVHGDNGSCKIEILQQSTVYIVAVESGIPQESRVPQGRMFPSEILEYGE